MRQKGIFTGEKRQKNHRKPIRVKLVRKSCRISRSEETAIRKMVQCEYDFYRSCLGTKKLPAINVTVYGNHRDFLMCQKSTPKYARSDFGFYDTEKRDISVFKDSGYLETCYHEISHFFLGTLFRMAPEWLDEGMAGYFENSIPGDEGWLVTDDSWQLKRIRKLIRNRKVSLKKIIGLSYSRFHRSQALDHYALSWGILFFLMYIDQHFVKQVIARLHAGDKSIDTMNELYPGGIPQLQKDFVFFYQ